MPVSSDGVIEATFDPEWASVRLVVDGGMWPSPVESVTIQRRSASEPQVVLRGLTRRPAVGGTFVGSDHEMTLGEPVTYRVTGYDAAALVVGASEVTVDTAGALSGMWIKVAGQPDYTVRTQVRAVSEIRSVTVGGVYQIAGGGTVAQTTAQWSGIEPDAGDLVLSVDQATLRRVRAALSRSRVVLMQGVGVSDLDQGWYYVSAMGRVNPTSVDSYGRRWVSLSVQRTGMPVGDGVGSSGVSWALVQEQYATWGDLQASTASWFELLKGDV